MRGWVLLPEGEESCPAVLYVHGGPECFYGEDIFFFEALSLRAAGFAVLWCNPRGSTGYGKGFTEGAYGQEAMEDLLHFVDACAAKFPRVDLSRLGVTGGSYGGYMTNKLTLESDRFKAAASQRSISNWMSFAYISDIGPSFTHSQHKVDNIIDEYERLWDFSPLKYANHATTPTLFIHSDEDYRCPMAEGMQMMQALLHNHIESKMVLFHGENHELSRTGKPAHRLRRLEEITGWFDKYAK